MGQLSLNGAIITTGIFIMFIILVAFIIPMNNNANLNSSNAHKNYCTMLQQKIDTVQDKDVLKAYIQEQAQVCSK